MKYIHARKTQSGFSLVGVIAMLLVMTTFMAWVGVQMLQEMRVRQGKMVGQDLARVSNVVLDFTRRFHLEIKEAAADAPASGGQHEIKLRGRGEAGTLRVQATSNPNLPVTQRHYLEISEQELGRLFTSMGTYGLNIHSPGGDGQAQYIVRFIVSGPIAGEKCKPTNVKQCTIDSLVYINQPVTRRGGRVDSIMLQAALNELGEGGGFSLADDGNNQYSRYLRFSRTTPIDNVHNPRPRVAGILAVHHLRRVDHLPYLRVDGHNTMLGPLKMNNNHIENVDSLSRSTQDSSAHKIVIHTDHITIGKSNSTPQQLQPREPPQTLSDRITIRQGKLKADEIDSHDIKAESKLETNSTLQFKQSKSEGAACDKKGIAVDASGSVMHCKPPEPGTSPSRLTWQVVHGKLKPPSESYIYVSTDMLKERFSYVRRPFTNDYTLPFAQHQVKIKWNYPKNHPIHLPYTKTHPIGVVGPDWRCETVHHEVGTPITPQAEGAKPKPVYAGLTEGQRIARSPKHHISNEIDGWKITLTYPPDTLSRYHKNPYHIPIRCYFTPKDESRAQT